MTQKEDIINNLPLWARLRIAHDFASDDEKKELENLARKIIGEHPDIQEKSPLICVPGGCQLSCLTSNCESSCQSACETSCMETCKFSCQDSCKSSCQDACEHSCQDSCKSSCQEACLSSSQET